MQKYLAIQLKTENIFFEFQQGRRLYYLLNNIYITVDNTYHVR